MDVSGKINGLIFSNAVEANEKPVKCVVYRAIGMLNRAAHYRGLVKYKDRKLIFCPAFDISIVATRSAL